MKVSENEKEKNEWQLEKKKIRLCKKMKLPTRPPLLKTVYRFICISEGYRPIKDIAFALNVRGGRYRFFGFYLFGFLRITLKRNIRIEPRQEWLVFLIHEITHQFVHKTRGTTEHDKSFYVVNRHLLLKYVNKILKHFDETSEEFENLEIGEFGNEESLTAEDAEICAEGHRGKKGKLNNEQGTAIDE
jgi:hypothetical protein